MSETSDPGLTRFEEALKSLAPAPACLDRDQLLFRAGQASSRRRGWVWPAASAVLAAVALTLGALLVFRSAPPPIERIIQVPAPPTQPMDRPLLEDSPSVPDAVTAVPRPPGYLRLRDEVLRWGADGLPQPAPVPPTDVPRLPLEDLLDGPHRPPFPRLETSIKPGDAL